MKVQKQTNNRNYFTQETEDAILLYNKTESPHQRSKIYSQHIHHPLFKLTQNIIHTFKFYYTDVDDIEHLQHRIIVFLLDKMYLYHHSKNIDDRLYKNIVRKYYHCSYPDYTRDVEEPMSEDEFKKHIRTKEGREILDKYGLYKRGEFLEYTNGADKITLKQIRDFIKPYESIIDSECYAKLKRFTPPKAYSYFGTIAKRWCINYNKQNYSKKINSTPVEDISQNPYHSYDLDGSEPSSEQLACFIDEYVDYITENIYDIFPRGNDPQYADAILDLFRKRDMIDIFNKKALYKNIRETAAIIGFEANTPKITKISDKLKEIFEKSYLNYIENGYIDFEG